MKQRTKILLCQALRLVIVAIEEWDSDDDEQPVEPARLLDENRVERDKARAELKRRGF